MSAGSGPQGVDADTLARLRAVVAELGGGAEVSDSGGVRIEAARAPELLGRLARDEALALTVLVDLTAVDRGPGRGGLEIVYLLGSRGADRRVRVTAPVAPDTSPMPSVVGLHPVADWLEREVFDQFGIGFAGHPDLRRILRGEDAAGHPLRKPEATGPATAARGPA